MSIYVYDPDPIDSDWPALVGPFETADAAAEYANASHPDDGSGNCVVLEAVAPDA